MAALELTARQTIEALRSGVPSDAAVRSLGTAQRGVEAAFLDALRSKSRGEGVPAIDFEANFGDGKSHLMHHLKVKAQAEGFATSTIIVGPDAPIGNAHVTLKAIAEEARLPNRTGKALAELAASGGRGEMADLRLWARDAPIADRFRALLRILEATQDDELRMLILDDFEGKPLLKTRISKELKALGEQSHFDLKGPRNMALAHDRFRLFGQFCRSHGHFGLVVFFDEVERIRNFSLKARLAAYEELGWWSRACLAQDVPLFAVFAQTTGFAHQCLVEQGDEARVRATLLQEGRDDFAIAGMELLSRRNGLEKASNADLENLQHGIRDLYAQAYGFEPSAIDRPRAVTTVRSEIRRWITEWDLARHYPGYRSRVEAQTLVEDTSQYGDELMPIEDSDA